jgi:2-polyprenyl-6-methoxyphenol hydroxylase-like FAD-dependent oxidoreductase
MEHEVKSRTVDATPQCASAGIPASLRQADVVVVGAGLSGSLAALLLERAGYSVVLIDRYAEHPPEFRVEKIGGDQVNLLTQLGLHNRVASASTLFNHIINAGRGRIIDVTRNPHYGILYHDLVNLVRGELKRPDGFVLGQVTDIKTGVHRQQVSVAGGTIEAKLVVLATGMSDTLRTKLGIRRRTVFEKHSISFGFNIAPAGGSPFKFPALTYYGEQPSDCIDYLNFFPIGDVMRANLFTFRDHRDEWIRALRREPEKTLLGAMPGLERFTGSFRVIDKVQNWIMDLYVLEDYLHDGVVLIGDSFQTSCPAAGTGVSRLLTDVHQLCMVHVPQWLATPGMPASKIAQFYADPVKRAADARSTRLADYRRSLTIDESWKWKAHRRRVYIRRRLFGWVNALNTNNPTRTHALMRVAGAMRGRTK